MTEATPAITHQPDTHRFEMQLEGHTAYAEYTLRPGVFVFAHTIVPKQLGGRGLGSQLAKHGLDYAAAQNLKVDPQCSFVKTYIDRHPEYQANSLAHDAKP
ncbi:MAG: GNAT family N-acetyltransferase [Brachymonas sp.]|nr:GNAT family N-acetyltransferase [Brachymonas sp.]